MVPYFHFEGGDNLLFKSWRPTSSGAIAGACIFLVFLAILERWLAAVRVILNEHWRFRAFAMAARTEKFSSRLSAGSEKSGSLDSTGEIEELPRMTAPPVPIASRRSPRKLAPFILAHDIPRGVIHAAQALLGYVIMLAVMTFHAGYIISIVLGLGVGEILFGRLGTDRGAAH